MKLLLTFISILLLFFKLPAQVNIQSGSATYSLPIFNWQDDKSRLNSVISLDYNSGNGLRVSDIASNVGQGWNLTAGGVITRMQVGEPDDQPENPGTGINDLKKYPAGYLYSVNSPTQGCPEGLTKYPIYQGKNQLYKQRNIVAEDREQDYFSFSFNGRTGTFILGEKFTPGTSTYQALTIGDSKLKITYRIDPTNDNIRTSIRSFSITDENGLVYTFSYLGLAKVLKTNYCNANLVAEQFQPHFKGNKVYHESSFESADITKPWVVGSWYLTEISDNLNLSNYKENENLIRKVRFNYNSLDVNTFTGTSLSYYAQENYSVISHLRTIGQVKEPSSITYPDGHQVVFNYNTQQRYDFPGEYALTSIDITYNTRPVSHFDLNTSYLIKNRFGTPLNDQQKSYARLYLKSVQKTGVDLLDSDLPYLFDYYLGTGSANSFVPPPYFYAKDIWGFYNGDRSVDYYKNAIPLDRSINDLSNDQIKGLCFIKRGQQVSPGLPIYSNETDFQRSNDGFAKNGLLQKITYPTGGAIHYDYVQNRGKLSGNAETQIGGVHVSQTKVTDGGFSNDCGHPLTTSYGYNVDSDPNVSSLWGAETPVNQITVNNHYEPEYKKFKYKPLFKLGCFYKYQYPGIQQKEQIYVLNFNQQVLQATMEVLDIVGTLATIFDIVNYLCWSGPVVAVIIDVIAILLNIAITCFVSQAKDTDTTIYYDNNINASNPLPSQYGRVEVTESSGETGKTVYEFTTPDIYPVWETRNDAKSMKQRFAYWAYGLPLRTSFYDKVSPTPNLVKQVENEYDWTKARNQFQLGPDQYTYNSCKCDVVRSSSQRNTNWESAANTLVRSSTDQNIERYHISTGRIQLSRTYERMYKPDHSNQALETVTDYEYNDQNYQVKSVTSTNSNGDITQKQITYSSDYTASNGGIFSTMNNNNLIAVPISSYTQKKEAGATNYSVLGETVTEFFTTAGQLKPSRVLERRFTAPQLASSVQLYQGTTTNNLAYFETQTFKYNDGNLIGLKDEGNHLVTNIYDYQDKFVIASVINADPNDDVPAYTSFETEKFGGWSPSNASVYTPGGITGNRSLDLNSNNSLYAEISSFRGYIVSLWYKNGTVAVSNATLSKSGPTLNGFTYNEYIVANGNTSVTVSGSATIDELRLYPETARMRTVTYDPLIGKTSECDENNRITYYEYDAQGRLRFIKDDKHDVVKMYEYNITQKKQGCPVTYFNLDIYETFTKNDCEVGRGGNHTYHIPAYTYTSTVSQEEVDRLVQQDLEAHGQQEANSIADCLPLYTSHPFSREFIKDNCEPGSKGTPVVYTVPEGQYTSTISQDDADEQAMDELEANGQVYANASTTACTPDYEPDWDADEGVATQCGNGSNGAPVGHMAVYMVDNNPNSPTAGQHQWKDGGEDPSCGTPQYFPAMMGDCMGNGEAQSTIHGNVGDAVVVEVVFSGTMQWTGLWDGAGGTIELSGPGQPVTNASVHYTGGTGATSFTTTATMSFTMPTATVTLTTKPILHNSSNNGSNNAILRVVSVNGVPRTGNNSAYVCTGNLGGYW